MRPPASSRLFIALWPSEPVRAQLAQMQSAWEWPERAAVVAPERLHVTLHFLGDVEARLVLDLDYVLKSVPAPQFDLHFCRAEMWPHGTVVLRPDNLPIALRGLHARIGLALATIGLAIDERPYRPHVTLARRAAGAKPPATVPQVHWEAKNGFVLVQTLAAGRGYEIVGRFGA